MSHLDIRAIRERLGLTQSDLAALLGFSVRAIQSCEQGWRNPSPSLERMALLLLIARRQGEEFGRLACWDTIACPAASRERCIASSTRQGHLCWFLTGNLSCVQKPLENWEAKKALCLACPFFQKLLGGPIPTLPPPLPEGAAAG